MQIRALELEGVDGIWMSSPLGACVLMDLESLDLYKARVNLLEGSLHLSSQEAKVLRQANQQLKVSLESTHTALQLEGALRKTAQKRTRKAKRRGKLFGIMAGLAGAALGITVGYVAGSQ